MSLVSDSDASVRSMASTRVPRSAALAFGVARDALDEQLQRIDSLDSKAGILLAADGILAGLIFGHETFARSAPAGVAIASGFFLLVSLAAAVIAFANRDYEVAPKPDEVIALARASEDWIRWHVLGNVLDAVAANGKTLAWKARLLATGQLALLVSLVPLGGYFIYDSIRKVL